jgi:hypothetical protein
MTPQQRARLMLVKRDYLPKVYAIISFGKMETSSFRKLGFNPRVEEIHNAVFTNTITPSEMTAHTFAVYQKVQDSNTLEKMDDNTLAAFKAIIKAGIMGDKRWVDTSDIDAQQIDWRRLLVYAEHENINHYSDYGIRVLEYDKPLIDTSKIAAYFPQRYQQPKPLKELIGDYQGDQTEYLMRIIHQTLKAPTLLNLIELTRELYRDTVNDDLLTEALEEADLTKKCARLIQILKEQTLLDEGYMPIAALNDRQTGLLRNHLRNHLKI